jgi:hypothetical protein
MLKRNGNVLWRELDGEAVLLDPAEGCSYNLNRVGTLIWKLLDGNHTITDIASAICKEFDVEHDQAFQDMEFLLDDLGNYKLLVSEVSSSDTI